MKPIVELNQEQLDSIHRYKYLERVPKGKLGFCEVCGSEGVPLYNEGYLKSLQAIHDDNIEQSRMWHRKYENAEKMLYEARKTIQELDNKISMLLSNACEVKR